MKAFSNRLARLETGEPKPVRFVMVGALARGEQPPAGSFTFTLDDPREGRSGDGDAPAKD